MQALTLTRPDDWHVPTQFKFRDETLILLGAGETLRWSLNPS